MKHTPLNRAARLALTALLSATALAPLSAQAQTWEYKSYKKSGLGGQYSKDNFVVGCWAARPSRRPASARRTWSTAPPPSTVSRAERLESGGRRHSPPPRLT